jgi:hypothetical protein
MEEHLLQKPFATLQDGTHSQAVTKPYMWNILNMGWKVQGPHSPILSNPALWLNTILARFSVWSSRDDFAAVNSHCNVTYNTGKLRQTRTRKAEHPMILENTWMTMMVIWQILVETLIWMIAFRNSRLPFKFSNWPTIGRSEIRSSLFKFLFACHYSVVYACFVLILVWYHYDSSSLVCCMALRRSLECVGLTYCDGKIRRDRRSSTRY